MVLGISLRFSVRIRKRQTIAWIKYYGGPTYARGWPYIIFVQCHNLFLFFTDLHRSSFLCAVWGSKSFEYEVYCPVECEAVKSGKYVHIHQYWRVSFCHMLAYFVAAVAWCLLLGLTCHQTRHLVQSDLSQWAGRWQASLCQGHQHHLRPWRGKIISGPLWNIFSLYLVW